MGRAGGTYWEEESLCWVLVGKAETKKPLARSACRWKDNITMYLTENRGILWNGLIWLRIEICGGMLWE
jgi:hypothetical protein